MNWIKTSDLRRWASSRNCQETLPLLVRKLIRATSGSIKKIKFPGGDNVMLGGWDGVLEVTEETDIIPLGVSAWEFGASSSIKSKADSDYKKRTANPLSLIPKETTFIFVTPRLWTKGEEWAEEKMKDNVWKEVRVINAEILEEWLEIAPGVSEWLAATHLGKPSVTVESTNWFWEKWITGPTISLNEKLLLGGRIDDAEKLKMSLNNPSIFAVKASAREESIAFIVSCFKDDSEKEEDFFARSILVSSPETFKQLIALDTPLIIIPLFEDDGSFHYAVGKGHNVIVPLGPDSSFSWDNIITLQKVERESFVSSLQECGLPKEEAEKYSKESARDITILRRQLGFVRNLPEWAKVDNVHEIIPALLVGRWDENIDSDIETLTEISGKSYEDYSKLLTKWINSPDSPFIKIGSTWRLASPLDAWAHAAKNITNNDFNLLSQSFLKIISEVDPALELEPDKRYMANIYGKKSKYSKWIREGVTQSLILVSIYAEQLELNLPSTGRNWVDSVILGLLENDDSDFWKSIDRLIPLIAEASPNAFLDSLENHLSKECPAIEGLFEEQEGIMGGSGYHNGLLWALEGLCWVPEYLSRSSIILAKLNTIDPGGNQSNRPLNSLLEVFKSWHYQTMASFSERIEVLNLLATKEPTTAWELLLSMLPEFSSGVAFPTHKMRWRMFNEQINLTYQYQEIYNTYSEALKIAIEIFDFTDSKLSSLIKKTASLSPTDRKSVFDFLETSLEKISFTENLTWNEVRGILSHHRSHPDVKWSLDETELVLYEELYFKLEPVDEIEKIIWMFNMHWPEFIEGHDFKEHSTKDAQVVIDEKRKIALESIHTQYGVEKIVELSKTVKEPFILGDTAAKIIKNENEIILICQELDNDENELLFIYGFLGRKSFLNDVDWALNLFPKLQKHGFSDKLLARFFTPISPSKKLWDYIDKTNDALKEEYWLNAPANFWSIPVEDRIVGLNKFVEYNRFFSAINICQMSYEADIPTEIIVMILDKTATEECADRGQLDGYKIGALFKVLDAREDVDSKTMIRLEWYFIHFLASYGTSRNPENLYKELSSDSDFFMEVLRLTYKPDDDELAEKEVKEMTEKKLMNVALHGYKLLESWKKVPGVNEKWEIDEEFLKKWVAEVREKANKCFRLDVADGKIGKILAQYREDGSSWPPKEICKIIEEINSDIINRSFSSAIFNKRGSTSRGPFDGGDIERENAKYFQELSNQLKNTFPIVAGILERLAKNYEQDAKRMDDSAERDKLDF